MFEIEMKARVLNKEKLLKQLTKELGKPILSIKEDTYFKYNLLGVTKNVRIRCSEKETYLTFKEKNIVDGLEINEENETTISDPYVMERLIIQMGGIKFFKKIKTVSKFTCGFFTIECCDVNSIGTFLEIETVVETNENVQNIKKEILDLFTRFNIGHECIEGRSYIDLIKENELVSVS